MIKPYLTGKLLSEGNLVICQIKNMPKHNMQRGHVVSGQLNSKEIPLYALVQQKMKQKILNDTWKIGQKIPTEMELCNIYKVSRITIRRAVQCLVDEKYLYKSRPIGIFVNDWITDRGKLNFTRVKSYGQKIEEHGEIETTLDVKVKKIKANKYLAKKLNVKLNEDILKIKRTRGYNEKPVALFINYIPYIKTFSLNSIDYEHSFYNYLKRYNIVMNEQKEYIEAIIPSATIQKQLKIRNYEPVLKRVRLCEDSRKKIREFSECFYIGEYYRYYVNL